MHGGKRKIDELRIFEFHIECDKLFHIYFQEFNFGILEDLRLM